MNQNLCKITHLRRHVVDAIFELPKPSQFKKPHIKNVYSLNCFPSSSSCASAFLGPVVSALGSECCPSLSASALPSASLSRLQLAFQDPRRWVDCHGAFDPKVLHPSLKHMKDTFVKKQHCVLMFRIMPTFWATSATTAVNSSFCGIPPPLNFCTAENASKSARPRDFRNLKMNDHVEFMTCLQCIHVE